MSKTRSDLAKGGQEVQYDDYITLFDHPSLNRFNDYIIVIMCQNKLGYKSLNVKGPMWEERTKTTIIARRIDKWMN